MFGLELWQLFSMLTTVAVGYLVYWKLMQPNCPGPFTLPILGSLGFYPYADQNNTWFDLMSKQHGSTWTGALPGLGTFVAILDPEGVEYILKSESAALALPANAN